MLWMNLLFIAFFTNSSFEMSPSPSLSTASLGPQLDIDKLLYYKGTWLKYQETYWLTWHQRHKQWEGLHLLLSQQAWLEWIMQLYQRKTRISPFVFWYFKYYWFGAHIQMIWFGGIPWSVDWIVSVKWWQNLKRPTTMSLISSTSILPPPSWEKCGDRGEVVQTQMQEIK